jgi:hypothetical protein
MQSPKLHLARIARASAPDAVEVAEVLHNILASGRDQALDRNFTFRQPWSPTTLHGAGALTEGLSA